MVGNQPRNEIAELCPEFARQAKTVRGLPESGAIPHHGAPNQMPKLKILWVCGLPRRVQTEVLGGQDYGAHLDWSWILGHLPPPENVELHIACRTARYTEYKEFDWQGARFHLIPVRARARVFCLFRFDWIYFRKLMARLNPDVVHGWGTEDAYANVAIKLSPERHVVEVQGN